MISPPGADDSSSEELAVHESNKGIPMVGDDLLVLVVIPTVLVAQRWCTGEGLAFPFAIIPNNKQH
jgi:hypothetical protein